MLQKIMASLKKLWDYEPSNISDVRVGDRFYSAYFRDKGTVVRYEDDNNWWFVLDERQKKALKANIAPGELKWISKVDREEIRNDKQNQNLQDNGRNCSA